jgi:hypothetical protein
MPSPRLQTRNASLATTASALIALVAVAAMMSSVPGSGLARLSSAESRASLNEAQTVRAVAAAVVAAARELTATHPTPAAATLSQMAALLQVPGQALGLPPDDDRLARPHDVAERLLDLPPPGC